MTLKDLPSVDIQIIVEMHPMVHEVVLVVATIGPEAPTVIPHRVVCPRDPLIAIILLRDHTGVPQRVKPPPDGVWKRGVNHDEAMELVVTIRQVLDDPGKHLTTVLGLQVDHPSTVERHIAKNRGAIRKGVHFPQQGADPPITVAAREVKGQVVVVVDPLTEVLFLDQEADPLIEVQMMDHDEATCRVVTPPTEVPFQGPEVDP